MPVGSTSGVILTISTILRSSKGSLIFYQEILPLYCNALRFFKDLIDGFPVHPGDLFILSLLPELTEPALASADIEGFDEYCAEEFCHWIASLYIPNRRYHQDDRLLPLHHMCDCLIVEIFCIAPSERIDTGFQLHVLTKGNIHSRNHRTVTFHQVCL